MNPSPIIPTGCFYVDVKALPMLLVSQTASKTLCLILAFTFECTRLLALAFIHSKNMAHMAQGLFVCFTIFIAASLSIFLTSQIYFPVFSFRVFFLEHIFLSRFFPM